MRAKPRVTQREQRPLSLSREHLACSKPCWGNDPHQWDGERDGQRNLLFKVI